MKINFRRITSSGSYIPEIDGIRFIAIFSVIILHLRNFVHHKDQTDYLDDLDYSFISNLFFHGEIGVPMFFVLSGFILGIPFAKYYLAAGEKVNLRQYFLRRLTRLEPPYIIVMTIMLVGSIYVAKTMSQGDAIKSYLLSLIYLQTPFLERFRSVNSVAWSLEVEVQFYILAPIIAGIFSIKPKITRCLAYIFVAVVSLFLNHYVLEVKFPSLINFVHYFVIGLLLADFYVSGTKILPPRSYYGAVSVIFLAIPWFFIKGDFADNTHSFMWESVQCLCIFFAYYLIVFHKSIKSLRHPLITNIGGMCYSIYLLHYPIISFFGNPLISNPVSGYSFINISVFVITILALILSISAVFYLFIERPCMDKYWYKKFI